MLALDRVMNFEVAARVDLDLPVAIVDYYRVFPDPPVTKEFVADIQRGIKNPLRIYTNGNKGVLRDGHHRLVGAKQLGIENLPVHIVPNWLERTYDDYELPEVEHYLAGWLLDNIDFIHTNHKTRRTEVNKRLSTVYCECGAQWRESRQEPWQHVMGAPKR